MSHSAENPADIWVTLWDEVPHPQPCSPLLQDLVLILASSPRLWRELPFSRCSRLILASSPFSVWFLLPEVLPLILHLPTPIHPSLVAQLVKNLPAMRET